MRNELWENWKIKVKTKDGRFIEEPERENDDDLIIIHNDKPKTLKKERGTGPKKHMPGSRRR